MNSTRLFVHQRIEYGKNYTDDPKYEKHALPDDGKNCGQCHGCFC